MLVKDGKTSPQKYLDGMETLMKGDKVSPCDSKETGGQHQDPGGVPEDEWTIMQTLCSW